MSEQLTNLFEYDANGRIVPVDLLSVGSGGTPGGEDTQNNSTRTTDTVTETATDIVWTATTGFGPFTYVDRYDTTAAAPADALINYWSYGSAVTLLAAETFTLDFGASVATYT